MASLLLDHTDWDLCVDANDNLAVASISCLLNRQQMCFAVFDPGKKLAAF